MRSYDAARGSFSLFEIIARIIIAVGILAAVAGGGLAAESMGRNAPPALAAVLGALPGGLIALAGIFGLALAQMGRATVDSAEYAQQALSVSRQQLELSREVLAQGKTAASSYAELLKRQPALQKPSASSGEGPSYGDRPEQADPVVQIDEDTEQIKPEDQASEPPAQLENTAPLTNGITDGSAERPLEPAVSSSGKGGSV